MRQLGAYMLTLKASLPPNRRSAGHRRDHNRHLLHEEKPFIKRPISLFHKLPDGSMQVKTVVRQLYFFQSLSHHEITISRKPQRVLIK